MLAVIDNLKMFLTCSIIPEQGTGCSPESETAAAHCNEHAEQGNYLHV
jgi:hypothetical protein